RGRSQGIFRRPVRRADRVFGGSLVRIALRHDATRSVSSIRPPAHLGPGEGRLGARRPLAAAGTGRRGPTHQPDHVTMSRPAVDYGWWTWAGAPPGHWRSNGLLRRRACPANGTTSPATPHTPPIRLTSGGQRRGRSPLRGGRR